MKKRIAYKQINILLIGVVHQIQAKGHIKWHIQKMREKGFSEETLEMFDVYLKKMRDELLRLCEEKNLDLVVEEGGVYDEMPADRWKVWIRSGKTILEEKYGDKHIFVDAKMPKFLRALREPSDRKREKVFVLGLENYLKKGDGVHNIVFVIGSAHLKRLEKRLKSKGFHVKSFNLNESLRNEKLKDKVKEDAKRIKEEKLKIKGRFILRRFWK